MTENPSEQVSAEKRRDDTIYIGKKPTMSYVLACVTQLNESANDIRVKARGKFISKAVDVVEVVRKRFVQDTKVKDIAIGTEQIEKGEDEKINVSSIEILIGK
ncbi:MAG: DNA-binding protein Alba [Candidatus Aenigmatarchaeota archaeon]